MSKALDEAIDAYDCISAAYDLIADLAEHRVRDRGLALLDAQPGERVLDLGKGTGSALPHLAARVGERGWVCGLDASAGMLARAQQRASAGRISLQRGDGRSLPYRQATFDAPFTSFTLELFEPLHIGSVLAELQRVLKPNGRLALVSLELPRGPNLGGGSLPLAARSLPSLNRLPPDPSPARAASSRLSSDAHGRDDPLGPARDSRPRISPVSHAGERSAAREREGHSQPGRLMFPLLQNGARVSFVVRSRSSRSLLTK